MEKPLLIAVSWVAWRLRWSLGLGNHYELDQLSLRYNTHLLALWLCPPFCLGESCPPALTLMPDIPVPPCMPLVPFKLLLQCWNSEVGSLCKFMCGFFKRNCLRPQKFLHWLNSCWFLQSEIMGIYLPATGTLEAGGGLVCVWDSSPLRYPSWTFIHNTWMWQQSIQHLHLSSSLMDVVSLIP